MMQARRVELAVRGHERDPIPVVHTAALAGVPVADGRLIPYLVLDTTNRPDVVQLVAVHEHLPPGDVGTTWAFMPKNNRAISLILEFKKPAELFMRLEFGIVEWGGVVDQIMRSKMLYLEPGAPGDRLDPTLAKPRILVEVMADSFQQEWDRILHSTLTKDFRKRGMPKRKAEGAAKEMVAAWRTFSGFRLSPE